MLAIGSSRIDHAVIKAFMGARPLHTRYFKFTRRHHAVPGNEGSSKAQRQSPPREGRGRVDAA
jgi:hypothetical protein